MKYPKITVMTISDLTGTMAPSVGANGQLGRIGLKSEITTLSGNIQSQIDNLPQLLTLLSTTYNISGT